MKPSRWLLTAGLVLTMATAGCSAAKTAHPATTSPTAVSAPPASFPDEGVPDTTQPTSADGKIGDVAELSDTNTGEPLAHVVVTRVKFSIGGEFNRPERGQWLGVYVKTKALADDQSSLWGDLYVTMRGHHYDADGCCPDGYTPALDYVTLNKGETAEGWLVFDVPARHGQVVLVNSMDSNTKLASWSF